MTEIFRRYTRRPADIDAAQVSVHTAEKIAIWCGGVYEHKRVSEKDIDAYLEIIVPNVDGNQKAHLNDYVVRQSNGRFCVMTEAELAANDYIEAGAPQPIRPSALTPHYVPRGKHPFGN